MQRAANSLMIEIEIGDDDDDDDGIKGQALQSSSGGGVLYDPRRYKVAAKLSQQNNHYPSPLQMLIFKWLR